MSYKCNEDALSLPIVGCDDCSDFIQRLEQIEQMMDEIYTTQITFTGGGVYVCNSVVCDAVLCGDLTVDATAEYIVESINKHNANNIVLEIGGVNMYVSDAQILDDETNEYRLIFPYPAGNTLLYHVVEGNDDGCSLIK